MLRAALGDFPEFLSNRYVCILFVPGVNGGGYTSSAFTGWRNVYLLVYHDDVVTVRLRMVELLGDVRRDTYLLSLRIGDEQVQEAVALTRQFAKGVEHGEEASLLTVHSHGEPDGGRLLADFRTSEEAASRLVGDEGLDALDVFSALDVGHLEGVGLYDVADGGMYRNRPGPL